MAEKNTPVFGRDVVDTIVEFDRRRNLIIIKSYPLFDFAAVKDVTQKQQKNSDSCNNQRIHSLISFITSMPATTLCVFE